MSSSSSSRTAVVVPGTTSGPAHLRLEWRDMPRIASLWTVLEGRGTTHCMNYIAVRLPAESVDRWWTHHCDHGCCHCMDPGCLPTFDLDRYEADVTELIKFDAKPFAQVRLELLNPDGTIQSCRVIGCNDPQKLDGFLADVRQWVRGFPGVGWYRDTRRFPCRRMAVTGMVWQRLSDASQTSCVDVVETGLRGVLQMIRPYFPRFVNYVAHDITLQCMSAYTTAMRELGATPLDLERVINNNVPGEVRLRLSFCERPADLVGVLATTLDASTDRVRVEIRRGARFSISVFDIALDAPDYRDVCRRMLRVIFEMLDEYWHDWLRVM